MKKWLFSDNGKITGPLGFAESQELIKNNPSLYAWSPSYTHWIPVNHIEEFELAIKIPTPPLGIPQELIKAFINEEQKLVDQLDILNNDLSSTHTELNALNTETQHYQQLTANLNKEVSAVISNIEQQYAALEKNLANVSKAGLQ